MKTRYLIIGAILVIGAFQSCTRSINKAINGTPSSTTQLAAVATEPSEGDRQFELCTKLDSGSTIVQLRDDGEHTKEQFSQAIAAKCAWHTEQFVAAYAPKTKSPAEVYKEAVLSQTDGLFASEFVSTMDAERMYREVRPLLCELQSTESLPEEVVSGFAQGFEYSENGIAIGVDSKMARNVAIGFVKGTAINGCN